jgi:hypothetical protein
VHVQCSYFFFFLLQANTFKLFIIDIESKKFDNVYNFVDVVVGYCSVGVNARGETPTTEQRQTTKNERCSGLYVLYDTTYDIDYSNNQNKIEEIIDKYKGRKAK